MAAGVPFFPVLTGATSREDFERFPYVEVLESVSSLPSYLAEIQAWPPPVTMPSSSP
jgi:hypothetical protein